MTDAPDTPAPEAPEPAPPAATGPLVSVRGLTRQFRLPSHFLALKKPKLQALGGVDLEIDRGEAFCVVGESGCGKTTLGRIVMGLLGPSSGEIHFGGTRIDRLSESQRRPYRARMQMVFQNPYASLNPRRSVGQTLAEPVRALIPGSRAEEVRDRVIDVMETTGCAPDWADRLPHEFSGGQRQRIAIARALVTHPEFVVADEPVSALDVSIQAQILNLLADLREARGLTYLFITHDLGVVRHFGSRVAVMYAGRVMELATTAEIFARPRHPYTQLLLSSIPKLEGGSFSKERPASEPPDITRAQAGCPFAPRCPIAGERCRREVPKLVAAGAARCACHAVEEGRVAA
ncbi:ATP-binding cassette domain-containing protein [Paralimibaculum aggregatum]|uniref:ATP-binding cassette domain-containing protein n=1 Tax=Paralimibaculum aggregatum TaxID=3036245 RepID=A0ABQ6LG40_9RHOB|nr:oligopeptide/dipeptide ABC transporter ATP-binding protein [Limibaculum sp. NKW23]GMG81957.1 ATP-binding cassette domain-containing protein [Limibaculum sp. NKW23]